MVEPVDKNNIFDDYADSKITLDQAFNKSASWYTNKIREFSKITPRQMMGDTSMYTTKPRKGEIYSFFYDPKLKDSLPFYDTFPLVLPLSSDKTSFLGLNFHYISPKDRMALLKLLQKRGRGANKLVITWDTIVSFAASNYANYCIKRYLFSHMKSPLRRIETEDIPTALLIPVERFVKKRKQDVWKNR